MTIQQRQTLYPSIDANSQAIEERFAFTDDLDLRDVTMRKQAGRFVFLHTVADIEKIERLMFMFEQNSVHEIEKITITRTDQFPELFQALIEGCAVLLLEGDLAYIFDTPIKINRSFEEPNTEKTVRGSHLGFIEDIHTNIYLLRKRIMHEQFKVKYFTLGTESNNKVAMVYMDDLANDQIVQDIEKKLGRITIDYVFAPGNIEELIEEKPLSPFPQNLYTERPDRVEAHLMEGRVAILCDGSADAIILPVTFFSFFQSPDDYHSRTYTSTVFRLLRLCSFIGTLLLPPLYIALVGFHFEIIPLDMVTLVKNSIEGVPFLPFFEALIMAITVEMIREAGIRLPSPIGETIGIVGGLIIGDAVVNAGLVSNVMVIVIALTAIMSFTISSYEMGNTVRILNFPIMIAASLFGFVGIVLAMSFILIHMCKLESSGVPYLAPLAPFTLRGIIDSIVRLPVWILKKRPSNLRTKKIDRQN